jgi:glutamate/tyrosine decarboxylase-like PLP-dependent enzyme
MWTNVCFRYVGNTDPEKLNSLNDELRHRLLQDGRFMVSKSIIDEQIILRSVISNNQITEQSLDSYIGKIVELGRDIERGLPAE